MGGGGPKYQKNNTPFLWVGNHQSFGFLRFSAEKLFLGPASIGLCGAEWDERWCGLCGYCLLCLRF